MKKITTQNQIASIDDLKKINLQKMFEHLMDGMPQEDTMYQEVELSITMTCRDKVTGL
jgi:hypothetical protein